MKHLPITLLTEFGERLLHVYGVTADKARYLAHIAVQTQAFGIHTHGLVQFPFWDKYIGDRVDVSAESEIVRELPATALLEGHRGFGALALRHACDLALDKARTQGIAMVSVRNTTWLGALGPHILPIAEAGFLVQLWAQTSDCDDCAPWGGRDGIFSTNPVALAFPTGDGCMLSDFSASAISFGRTQALIRDGKQAPENLYLDRQGHPTADPAVVDDGGTIQFMGGERYGYRGYAFALWAEALTAMAGGSARTSDNRLAQAAHLVVIDPNAFVGISHYLSESQRLLAEIRGARLRPGFDTILLPGERAQRAAQAAARHGVPVEEKLVAVLNELADRHGIPRLPTDG